jgi:hypothetical protein
MPSESVAAPKPDLYDVNLGKMRIKTPILLYGLAKVAALHTKSVLLLP